MMKMIDHVCAATVEYIDHMPKSKRKKYGQFFTSKETAVFMAGLFSLPEGRTSLSILDPGAGSGILSVALLERLESNADIDTIELVCYENDSNIVDLLRSNLEWLCNHTTKKVSFRIVTDNYILSQMLNASKNIILFLSANTKNSKALREELDYGINTKGLPVIVIYPDFKEKTDIWCSSGMRKQVTDLWDKLPVFRDNMYKVATLHVPYKKSLIISALNDADFKVQTMAKAGQYHYKLE